MRLDGVLPQNHAAPPGTYAFSDCICNFQAESLFSDQAALSQPVSQFNLYERKKSVSEGMEIPARLECRREEQFV